MRLDYYMNRCMRYLQNNLDEIKTVFKYNGIAKETNHLAFLFVKKEMIIGYNHSHGCMSMHAELDAINKYQREKKRVVPSNATLVVISIQFPKNGDYYFKYSRPCSGCTKILDALSITRVYYSITDKELNLINSFNDENQTIKKYRDKRLYHEIIRKVYNVILHGVSLPE